MYIYESEQGKEPERQGISNRELFSESNRSGSNKAKITDEELDKLTLDDYGLTPDVIRGEMFGWDLADPNTGEPIDDKFYESKMEKALAQAEHTFDIAIIPRRRDEYQDLYDQNVKSYLYTTVYKRPIIQVDSMSIEYNNSSVVKIQQNQIKVYHLGGQVEVLSPFSHQYHPIRQIYSQYEPFNSRGMYGNNFAPQMVHINYVAGLLPRKHGGYASEWEMPADLEEYLIKTVVKETMTVYGRLLVPFGLQESDIMIDGIRQRYRTTNSATNTPMSGYINQITDRLKELEDGLRSYFGQSYTVV